MSEPNPQARIERLSPALDSAQAALHEAEQIVRPSFQERIRQILKEKLNSDGTQVIEVGALEVEKDYNPETGSQQITADQDNFGFLDIREELIEPPINLKLWATQLARSTRLNRGIRTIARNTVGIGFEIVPIKPFKDDTPESEKKAFEVEAERVTEFLSSLNPESPFEALMECVVMDEEATGNGYLEFTRAGGGQLLNAFHIPSVTMRILRMGRGFVQVRGGKKRYFRKFGDPRVMDARNGKFQGEPGFNQGADSEGAALPIENRATEVLHFLLYHPMSDTYGLPRFISAGAAITGNWLSGKRNVIFFKNDAVPRMAVLVSGGKLDDRSREDLANYLQDGQGEEQAHRVLVLQVEDEGVGVDGKSNTRLDLKPMTVGVTEDGSFLNYRIANDEEIREALGLSEVYFRSQKLTKASAIVAKATTDEQEFEPARKHKEHRFNQLVIRGTSGLGAKRCMLRFARPETSDPLERAQEAKLYSDMAAMTPNEVRRKMGMDPFPPNQEWANWPLPVLLIALQGSVVGDLIGRPDLQPIQAQPPAGLGQPSGPVKTPAKKPATAPADTAKKDDEESDDDALLDASEGEMDTEEEVDKDYDPLALAQQIGGRLRKLSSPQ